MKVYFTASYSTKRVAAVLGSVLLSAGMFFVVLMALQRQDITLFLGYFFGVVFAVAGVWLLKVAAKEKRTMLTINSEGVSYGTQSYSWAQIAEIGVMPGGKEFYCRPRAAGFALEFPVSCRVKTGQIRELFEVLKREIVPLHPHVKLCDDG